MVTFQKRGRKINTAFIEVIYPNLVSARIRILFVVLLIMTYTFLATFVYGQEDIKKGRSLHADMTTEIVPDLGIIRVKAKLIILKTDINNNKLEINLDNNLKITKMAHADGTDLPFTQIDFGIRVDMSEAGNEEQFVLTIEYEGLPLSRSIAHVGVKGSYASWLDFWYPSLTNIQGLIGSNKFIVPRGIVVASNGSLVGHKIIGDKEEFIYQVNTPLYYSFAAAPYYHQTKLVNGIEYEIYLLSCDKEKADYYLNKTAPLISFYKNLFGIYPYDNLKIIEIPQGGNYRGGGNSEQGLIFLPKISISDSYFNFPVWNWIGFLNNGSKGGCSLIGNNLVCFPRGK